ncbi:3-hydroxy-3-methylglutaryl-coenzyme A reductase [Chionoecetes opilio]|uniref:hydroxymethylglutaryl-CoA reductase (NADPH) n=1 Tax=Chionoecetes opilio TaxID=41210 RepID=A0A8J5CQ65_CHIOP|nr:3-hydroxy-3-methylglutaryl-coenzyme A reductase [Chionoecetes opilio]
MWVLWDVGVVGCGCCGMWVLWDVGVVGCGCCGMWVLWDVGVVGCGCCGMWVLWDVVEVEAGRWCVRSTPGSCRRVLLVPRLAATTTTTNTDHHRGCLATTTAALTVLHRMSRGTRGKRGTTREEPKPSRRQETFRATSECAQEAQRRAHQCFLSLIDGPVDPQVFVAKARYINLQVYSDVVVERAVGGLCGYAMCRHTLTDTHGARTYVIRANKVYDITERRNFCSNVCYEASEVVRRQVLKLPLYLRDTDDADIKDVCLPDLTKLKGRHGKLVDITGGINDMEMNDAKKSSVTPTFKTIDDIARVSLVNWSEHEAVLKEDQTSDGEMNESNKADQNKIKVEENGEERTKEGRSGVAVPGESPEHVTDHRKEGVGTRGVTVMKEEVESVMRRWVSFDSLRVVLGDLYLRGMLEHMGHSWDNYDTTSGLRLGVEAKARYIAICRRLEHDERLEEGRDTLDLHPEKQTQPSNPLPDYSRLQREAKNQKLKVSSFRSGQDQSLYNQYSSFCMAACLSVVGLLNAGLDHIVFMVILGTLIVKYVLFESHAGKNMAGGLRQCTRCHAGSFSRHYEEAAMETDREDRGSQTEERGFEVVKEAVTKDEDQPLRTLEECVAVMKSEAGAKSLSDSEVVLLVEKKQLPGYQLEKVLGDPARAVAVRRCVVAPHTANLTTLDDLPHLHYDYSKVVGVCCENVVGYMPVPVGVAGPLMVNGQKYMVPLATTEGCLVASTNRGCRALVNGVKSEIIRDGMTRAPSVRMPSATQATEVYIWLRKREHFAIIKEGFDSTSRFARMQDLHVGIAGRLLYMRFVAQTGDAMGMNMVSKVRLQPSSPRH